MPPNIRHLNTPLTTGGGFFRVLEEKLFEDALVADDADSVYQVDDGDDEAMQKELAEFDQFAGTGTRSGIEET